VIAVKLNEGSVDRIIRVVAGIILLVVGIVVVKGTIGIVLDVVGGILLVTGAVGFCPLYALFHLNTSKKA
jgi:hypothetical protein